MEFFSAFELQNLREVLMRLINRDNRTGVFEKDFWVLEKTTDVDRKIHDLKQTLLVNIPHVYSFQIRARVFQNFLQ